MIRIPDKIKILTLYIFFPILVAHSMLVSAQNGITLPQVENMDMPDYQRADREAIVLVRYTIQADGTTSDIETFSSYSTTQFDGAAASAAENWTFQPARVDGEAIDLLNQEYIIGYTRPEGSGLSADTREAIEQGTALIEEQNYQEAIDRMLTALESDINSIYDYVLINNLLSTAYMGLGLSHEALAAVKQASLQLGPVGDSPGGEKTDILPANILDRILRRRFILEASLSQNFEAMQTYDRLGEVVSILNADPINTQVSMIRSLFESGEPAGMLAKITSNDRFTFKPEHRAIAVTDVSSGAINSILIRCQRRNVELDFEVGVEWSLPESFGQCEFDFLGENDTEFTIYQFAD